MYIENRTKPNETFLEHAANVRMDEKNNKCK